MDFNKACIIYFIFFTAVKLDSHRVTATFRPAPGRSASVIRGREPGRWNSRFWLHSPKTLLTDNMQEVHARQRNSFECNYSALDLVRKE